MGTCHYCNIVGHMESECRKKATNKGSGKGSKAQVHCAYVLSFLACLSRPTTSGQKEAQAKWGGLMAQQLPRCYSNFDGLRVSPLHVRCR